ncbi:MAG: ankyrin repeat domain-containing protein [Wolbachia endosymbiont of Xenopsylla cheopis]
MTNIVFYINILIIIVKFRRFISLEEQLLEAIESRNTEEVRSLLDQGADVNAKNSQGISVISFAVMRNHKDIVQLLIEHKANVNDQFSINESNRNCTYTPVTSVFVNGLHEGNIRDVRDILELLLKAGGNPDTIVVSKNEGTNEVTEYSIFKNANPEILFLFFFFGAKLKNEDLAIIRENSDLQNCLTAFAEIKAMPHLGKLIEANIKKEGTQAIAEYINNKAKGQELIKEFRTIKERYGSDEQLSFIPEYLLDAVEHSIKQHLQEHKMLLLKKDTFRGFISNITGIDTNYPIYDFSDTDVLNMQLTCKHINSKAKEHEKAFGAVKDKSNKLLNKLRNICQSPNTALAESQIEPSAEHQHMER